MTGGGLGADGKALPGFARLRRLTIGAQIHNLPHSRAGRGPAPHLHQCALRQRLFEIRNDIFCVFDAYGQAHQVIADADALAVLGGEVAMRAHGGI